MTTSVEFSEMNRQSVLVDTGAGWCGETKASQLTGARVELGIVQSTDEALERVEGSVHLEVAWSHD